MGWGDCGDDSEGRPIGYVFPAACDHDRCEKAIDRGLSYACGDMHGANEYDCEKYFCENHQRAQDIDGTCYSFCFACCDRNEKDGIVEDDTGEIMELMPEAKDVK